MNAVTVLSKTNEEIRMEVVIKFNRSMLDSEYNIRDALNRGGEIATNALLETFDTDGTAIKLGSIVMTSKGQSNKEYQTPYGPVNVKRHVYQTSEGGSVYCPLERDARIIGTATPAFAALVSHKMTSMSAPQTQRDLELNHGRKTEESLLQRTVTAVGQIAEEKEEKWSYHVPNVAASKVKTICTSIDGACIRMVAKPKPVYRQVMVGTISLYDKEGERLYTTYVASAPEYGKQQFKERMTKEIEHAKKLYPDALRIGVADGAHDNWTFLEQHTSVQVLDFYHATEYINKVAEAAFVDEVERKKWAGAACHKLKHEPGEALRLIEEMRDFKKKLLPRKRKRKLSKQEEDREKIIEDAITYFKNNTSKGRMEYSKRIELNQPIGSGVTEAACKTVVKQRLCQSGMSWKDKGASHILILRALACSSGRWEQFWQKINQYGC